METRPNPYTLEPVQGGPLLRTRRLEIQRAIRSIRPDTGDSRHVLIKGDDRSGRTSVLDDVARRLDDDGETLIVRLHLHEDDLTTSGVPRALVNAVVETLVAGVETPPDWYLAWIDRVLLRRRDAAERRDILLCGLAYAADPAAILDRTTLQRDLATLSRLAGERGRSRIAVCIDDADALFEDIGLVEDLVETVDGVPGWSLAVVTGHAGHHHLVQAVSPVLRRFVIVRLVPFWTFAKLRACLTAPLDSSDVERLMPEDPGQLLMDVLGLTSGNPFEIAIVAQQLWLACKLGEQERYELTPRVVERSLTNLAYYTGVEAELVDGARAVERLEPGQLRSALELVALSRLSSRQIAIARLLGVPNSTNAISDRILSADIDDATERVVEELDELERQGVVVVHDDGTFTVQGGQRAAVALKYHARALLGPDAGEKPFGIPFLECVGEPLAEDYARRIARALPGVRRLASTSVSSLTSSATSARLRAAVDAKPFAGLDADFFPFDLAERERMVDLLLSRSEKWALVVVDLTLSDGARSLDLVEVWEVPGDLELHAVNEAASDILDEWRALVEASSLRWHGAHAVRFGDEIASPALIQLYPSAAEVALQRVWREWMDGDRSAQPDDVLALVRTTVIAHKAHHVPDWERGWELSVELSRLGFLLCFYDDRVDDAREALEQAKAHGPADGWVTDWNLAYLAARSGDFASALERLDAVDERGLQNTMAWLLFFVPGRDPSASLVTFDGVSAHALFALQRTMLGYAAHECEFAELETMIEACEQSGETGARVAEWVRDGVSTGLGDARKSGGTAEEGGR